MMISTTQTPPPIATEEFITAEQWSVLLHAYCKQTPINGKRISKWNWSVFPERDQEMVVHLALVPGETYVAHVDDARARALAEQQMRMPVHQLLKQLLLTADAK